MKKPLMLTADGGRVYAAPSCDVFRLDPEVNIMSTTSTVTTVDDVEEEEMGW